MGTVNPPLLKEEWLCGKGSRVWQWRHYPELKRETEASGLPLVCCLPVGGVIFSPLTCFSPSPWLIHVDSMCSLVCPVQAAQCRRPDHCQGSHTVEMMLRLCVAQKLCSSSAFLVLWGPWIPQNCSWWVSLYPKNALISYFFKNKHLKPRSAKRIQNNRSIQRSQQMMFSELFAIPVLLNMPCLVCMLVFIQNVAKELNHRMEMLEMSWSLLFPLLCGWWSNENPG